MNKALLSLWFLALSFNAFSGITMVSDLDETIKITNSGSVIGAAMSAFKKSRSFTGIPEFFKGSRSYVDKTYILSASPPFLKRKIRKILKGSGIEYDEILLKPWTKFEDRLKYKIRMVKKLMEESQDDFLLLGDDVGDDPEVYAEIQKLFPNRVLAVYIHIIKDRKVPANSVTHWTAHDLAIREHAAGRMSADIVEKVIMALKSERELKYVFPKFAVCPQTAVRWAYQLNTMFADLVFDMNNDLVSFCQL